MSDDKRRKYQADVVYEVWRSGGNPDAVNYDRLDEARYEGLYAEEAAVRELRYQRRRSNDALDATPREGETQ